MGRQPGLSENDRQMALGMVDACMSVTDVVDRFNVHKSTVYRLKNSYQQTALDRSICRRPKTTIVKGGALHSLYVNTGQVFCGHNSSALTKGSCWCACQYLSDAMKAWSRNWFWITQYSIPLFDPLALHTKNILMNMRVKHTFCFSHVIIHKNKYVTHKKTTTTELQAPDMEQAHTYIRGGGNHVRGIIILP